MCNNITKYILLPLQKYKACIHILKSSTIEEYIHDCLNLEVEKLKIKLQIKISSILIFKARLYLYSESISFNIDQLTFVRYSIKKTCSEQPGKLHKKHHS